jgi:hypothetical protein
MQTMTRVDMLKAKLIITSDTNDSSVVVVFGSGAQV